MESRFIPGNKRDLPFAYKLLSVLSLMWEPNIKEAVKRRHPSYFTSGDRFTQVEKTSKHPQALGVQWDDQALIFIAGTDGSQVPSLLGSYNDLQGNYPPTGVNYAFLQGWEELRSSLGVDFFGRVRNWGVAGHSFGGAIAQAALVLGSTDAITTRPSWCVTFGSPRPGSRLMQERFNSNQCVRYFNHDDPIPYVPPHRDESPTLHNLVPSDFSRAVNRQVQTVPGFEIQANGTMRFIPGEENISDRVILDLGSWILSTQGIGSSGHSIAEYMRRIELAQSPGWADRLRDATSPVEQPFVASQSENSWLARVGQAMLAADARNPAGASSEVTLQRNMGEDAPRYVARKIGEQWVVRFQNATVAVATGKRHAKRMAREYNRATRT